MDRKERDRKWRTSEKGRAYMLGYQKAETKLYGLRLNKVHDADIIEWLESLDNMSGWLKKIIREAIDKGK